MTDRVVAREIAAWDLPTRLFHWSLVALMAATWATFEYGEALNDPGLDYHKWSGYAILVLIVWRVLWGFFGSTTARFASFLRGPGAALRYLRDLAIGAKRHFLGHNPVGAWMMIALLTLAGGQAVLGLFTIEHNDITEGPLYKFVSEDTGKILSRWHRLAFDYVILPVIGLHITANILYGVVKKEPLIPAMIKGTKPAAAYEDHASGNNPPPNVLLRAALLLALAIALVFVPILAVGGRL